MKKNSVIFIFILFSLSNTVFSGNIVREERDFNKAVEIFNKSKDYSIAVFQFEKFIKMYPSSKWLADCYYWAGQCYFNLDEYDKSLEKFLAVIKNYKKSGYYIKSFFKTGNCYYQKGEFASSSKYYNNFLKKAKDLKKSDKEKKAALLKLGISLYNLGEYQKAVDNFEKLFREYPETGRETSNLILTAKSYYFLKDYENTRKFFNQALELKTTLTMPELKEIDYYRGEMLYNENKVDEALEYYNNALANTSDTNNDFIIYSLGWTYLKLKNDTAAITTFLKILKFPFSTLKKEVYFLAGRIAFKNKDYIRASSYYRSSIKLFPEYKHTETVSQLIKSDYYLEKYNDITEIYKKENLKFDDDIFYITGISYYKTGMYEKTIEVLNHFIDRDNKYFIDSKFYKGKSYFHLGKYLLAVTEFKMALATPGISDKNFYSITRSLAETYYKQEKYDQAIKHYIKLAKIEGEGIDRSEILFNLGQSYLNFKRENEAVAIIQVILKEYPDSIYRFKSLYLLGNYFYLKKEYEKADKYLSEIIITGKKIGDIIPASHFILGDIEIKKNNFLAAKQHYYLITENFKDSKYYNESLFKCGVITSHLKEFELSNKFLLEYKQLTGSQDGLIEYYTGLNYYNLKKYDKTVEQFKRLLQKNTDKNIRDEELYFYIGKSQYFQKKYDAAIKTFTELNTKFPAYEKLPEILYIIAEIYYLNGDFDNAKKNIYELNLIRKPGTWHNLSLFLKGKISIKENKLQQAIKEIKMFVKKSESFEEKTEGSLTLGQTYFKLDRYKEAIKHLLISKESKDILIKQHSLFMLGKAYYNTRQYNEALKYFTEIITNFPEYENIENTYFLRGLTYIKLEQFDKTIEEFKNYIKKNPSNQYAESMVYWIGNSYFHLKDYARSITEYRKVLNTKNKKLLFNILYDMGNAFFNNENYDSAVFYYNRFRKEFPDSDYVPEIIYGMGLAFYHKGDYAEFVKNYEELVEKYPERSEAPEALVRLGNYFHKIEDFNSAISYLKKLEKNYPDFQNIDEGKYLLGLSYYKSSNYKSAIDVFTKLKKEEKTGKYRDEINYVLGESFFKTEHYKKSVKYYSEITSPTMLSQSRYKIILSQFSDKDFKECIKKIDEYNNEFPDSENKNYILFLKGVSLFNLNRHEEGRNLFIELAHKKIDDSIEKELLIKLASSYYNDKKYNDAVKWFAKYKSKYEFKLEHYYMLANCYFNINAYENAGELFEHYINNISDTETETREKILLKLSVIYEKTGQFSKQIETNNKIINEFGKSSELLMKNAVAYIKSGNETESIKLLDDYMQEFNNYKGAVEGYAEIIEYFKKKDDGPNIIKFCERLIDLAYDKDTKLTAKYRILIGNTYFKENRYQEALVEFLNIDIKSGQILEDSYYGIIKSYIKLKNMKQAKAYYIQLQKENPESSYLKEFDKYDELK